MRICLSVQGIITMDGNEQQISNNLIETIHPFRFSGEMCSYLNKHSL